MKKIFTIAAGIFFGALLVDNLKNPAQNLINKTTEKGAAAFATVKDKLCNKSSASTEE